MSELFTAMVPRLETARLTLREYRREDFEAFVAHLTDPASTVHLSTSDRSTAWRTFNSHAGMWALYGAGWWMMERRDTGQAVGCIGAFYREGAGGLEIGWNTWREHWGQGFAGEAAEAVVVYAFEVRQEPRVHALISEGNTSSIRVAERAGLSFETETDLNGKPVGMYTLTRP
ncbi:GNAT family N-acetyltransferase [Luteibacter aegosomaticola]|uniref:GNAT family N-acetyltransferase n=1 Tax=Luteibacter aegosomaticola TaxID=2911538 RepID=UPI001FF6FE73|nr:GNAT family N-acetyltransferase [Luteibacter aegosomaticola]UPG92208.1 GNAT family N-acetyltransferase [Luteibacter aegosomaticola]